MAWRNIWRNKRRTLITAASIFFAVFFSIVMRSFQLGTYGHMIKQSIEKFSGYLQVQAPDYFDDPNLDNAFESNPELMQTIQTFEGIKAAAPRVESFALASAGHHSKAVMVSGIDPFSEQQISNPEHLLINYSLTPAKVAELIDTINLPKKQIEHLNLHQNSVYNNLDALAFDLGLKSDEFEPLRPVFEKHTRISGRFLEANDEGVLISNKLSKYLNVETGDTLVLIGQGYHGTSAAALFPVRGIVRIPAPDLDNKLVYMTIERAQQFFNLGTNITSIVMNLDDTDLMRDVQSHLAAKLDKDKLLVKNWEEMNPTLKQQIEGDNKSGQIMVGVLYFIIFFGIFGTVLMMINERKREFGVLVAIGMRKSLLVYTLVIEMFFLGLIGTLAGMMGAIPVVLGFYQYPIKLVGEVGKMFEDMGIDPIMPTAPLGHYFTWQAVIILFMVLVACYLPLNKIRKMKVAESLKA
jgi:ABC-type lipoprotein release transport system permease subunit